jgi:hypothetical protein
MDLNIHTYEAWLLDYIEGRLSKQDIQRLEDFLSLHPELQAEMNDYAFIPLVPQPHFYPEKDELKKFNFEDKMVSEQNIEDFCIASHEHLLSAEKQHEVNQYIADHPQHFRTFELYSQAILKPNVQVRYPFKEKMYRKGRVVRFSPVKLMSVAASALLLLGVALWWLQDIKESVVPPTESTIVYLPVYKIIEKAKPKDKLIHVVKVHSSTVKANSVIEQQPKSKATAFMEDTAFEPIKIKEDMSLRLHSLMVNSMPRVSLAEDEDILYCFIVPVEKVTALNYLGSLFSKIRNPRSSVISAIGAGVNGLGELTSTNLKFTARRDSVGQISAYSLQAGNWKYYNLGSK